MCIQLIYYIHKLDTESVYVEVSRKSNETWYITDGFLNKVK